MKKGRAGIGAPFGKSDGMRNAEKPGGSIADGRLDRASCRRGTPDSPAWPEQEAPATDPGGLTTFRIALLI
jgi:hypothetical protein